MSVTRNIYKPDIYGKKTAETTSKWRHDAQIPKGQKENIEHQSKIIPIIHITIQTVQDKIRPEKKKFKKKSDTRVSCVKSIHDSSMDIRDKDKRKPDRRKKTRVIFPEMRGSVLYSRCCCLHRDGLQDHCPLSQCQGRPECLVKPWAVCPPGKFIRLRHPELYPEASSTSCNRTMNIVSKKK